MRRLVMSAITLARVRAWCSGGKGRRGGDPAANDTHGARELDPVGVDVGFGGRPADQGAERVMGQQVAVDFLADGVRLFRPQDLGGPA